ncbi:hypothetical protein ACFPXP_07905 [Marinicrinis lubricantis]|uniref:Uncharacterized protein n=1 Tax=Marinicrinis lubricantis TaxID=2086470 RepID=A0ABW1IMR7_9BACL
MIEMLASFQYIFMKGLRIIKKTVIVFLAVVMAVFTVSTSSGLALNKNDSNNVIENVEKFTNETYEIIGEDIVLTESVK